MPKFVVPAVATTAKTSSGPVRGSSAARSAAPVSRPRSSTGTVDHVDVHDPRGVRDRRVRLGAARDDPPVRAPAAALAPRRVPRGHQRGQVADRAALHEDAAGRRPGSPARSAIQRSAWFSA